MTDNKLTLQDCFKYPEAEIRHNSGGSFKSVFELIIKSYDVNMSTLYMLADYDCKLILRDISELTDEEKKYINDNFVYELLEDEESIWFSFDELCSECEDKLGLINYLREKNIIIESEDWFKQGKAVKG